MRTLPLALLGIVTLLVSARAPLQEPQPDPGRAGSVLDLQGIVLVRPVGRERWTALRPQSPLWTGDLVRTEARGANAVEIALQNGARLVLGPGAQLEVAAGDAAVVQRGEVEVVPEAKAGLKVRGPGGYAATLTVRTWLRAGEARTEILGEAPRWLTGYRASTTDEWMGSLLATVDGRAVPLAVGYHKVDVVIRDQIAETTVEQSFVNQTAGRLEGTFRFPLPADASISGFGMWIGNELVEADIVEKQRARQIYEEILRERRDPGLLEWSGGNLFTARVFPIEAHSEKRVRLRYTQVLPLLGDTLTYRYALRSELLRQRPLRNLALRVSVTSTQAIAGAACPSHPVRTRQTAHEAVVEHEASEVTPERDFELRIAMAQGAPLTLVPHRRGDDGYFALLLQPPDPAASGLRRELVPERGALRTLLLLDTSASMDGPARAAQRRFVQAFLAQLSAKDAFELWTCDLGVRRFRDAAVPATETNSGEALAFLEARDALGWTDLERAFGDVRRHAAAGTMVVYVGDGIQTSGDGDPQGLALRLRTLLGPSGLVCHAVAPGSTYDLPVLEAIASCGGGSCRALADDVAGTAFALLVEAAQPTVKDLRVDFAGLRTARVYPERLPNLPAGAQQIALGRYLPGGEDQRGRVVVTGTLEGKPLHYSADVVLRADDAGNSFLPRLWARRHLDALLARGTDQAVREEIVAFSIEYGILTPYTSLLVLESDEDRQRFGVDRRVKMRDGEAFFAQARDRAQLEILRQQVQAARAWRMALREQMLAEIRGLGRDLLRGQAAVAQAPERQRGQDLFFLGRGQNEAEPPGDGAWGERGEEEKRLGDDTRDDAGDEFALDLPHELAERDALDYDVEGAAKSAPAVEDSRMGLLSARLPARRLGGRAARDDFGWRGYAGREVAWVDPRGPSLTFASFGFPELGTEPAPAPVPEPKWDAEIRAALRALDRRARLAQLAGGVALVAVDRQVHPLRGTERHSRRSTGLVGAAGWYLRSEEAQSQTMAAWFVAGTRAAVAADLRLGRRRAGSEAERARLAGFAFPFHDGSLTDWEQGYATHAARLVRKDGDRLTVVLAKERSEVEVEVDAARGVLVRLVSRQDGRVLGTTRCAEFVQVQGLWFATRVEHGDGEGRITWRQDVQVAVPERELGAALAAAAAGHEGVLFVGAEDPDPAKAKQARHEGRAGFEEQFAGVLEAAGRQDWNAALAAFDAAAQAAGALPGVPWLRLQLLTMARQGEAAHGLARALAAGLAREPQVFLPHHLLGLLAGILAAQERHALWQTLRPDAGDRDPRATLRRRAWNAKEHQLLLELGRHGEALRVLREIRDAEPDDHAALFAFASALVQASGDDEAVALLRDALARKDAWTQAERDGFHQLWTGSLLRRALLVEARAVLEAWTAEATASQEAWHRLASVLYLLGDEHAADAWVAEQLALEPAAALADPKAFARLGAAVSVALGDGHGFHLRRADERWHGPLARLARGLAASDQDSWLAGRIVGDWRFHPTDAAARLRKDLAADLAAPGAIAAMSLQRLQRYLQWIPWGRTQVDRGLWEAVVAGLRARLAGAAEEHERAALARHVLGLLDAQGERAAALAFLREQVADPKNPMRVEFAHVLAERLPGEPWSEALEDELFALLAARLAERDPARRAEALAALVRGTADAAERMRFEGLLGPKEVRETWERTVLRQKVAQARGQARADLAAALRRRAKEADDDGRPWYTIEALCLRVAGGAPAQEVEGEARELLAQAEAGLAKVPAFAVLRERAILVLSHLCIAKDAGADLVERTLELLRQRAAAAEDPEAGRRGLFRLLVALDRSDALLPVLRAWVDPKQVAAGWRIALGYLLAERGALAEAAEAFEALQKADSLDAAGYRAIAGWYLALGDDARRERALRERLRVTPEQELGQRLWVEHRRVQPRGDRPPQGLDPEILAVLRALLAKASHPGQHLHAVGSLYATTKDHRLLESLADGVIGHSVQGVYGFLVQALQLLNGVHEEATCDVVLARVEARLAALANEVDRRALLLLRLLAARRAAEVHNQRGPHAQLALASLRDGFRGAWRSGERVQMAAFLAALGKVPDAALAAEQERQLRALLGAAEGPDERLAVAGSLARTLRVHGALDRSCDELGAALREHREAGRPAEARRSELFTLADWLEYAAAFAAAETLLVEEQERCADARGFAYRDRVHACLVSALAKGGTVSLGRDRALYDALRQRLQEALFREAMEHVEQTLQRLCATFAHARDRHLGEVAEHAMHFAMGPLQELATRVPARSARLVLIAAQSVHNVAGPERALEVALARLVREPLWLTRSEEDLWSQAHWNLAQWRAEARTLGELERPLLQRVLRELERDLLALDQRSAGFYDRRQSTCWRAHTGEYRTVARRVLEEHAASPARVLHAATVLWGALDARDEAVAALERAAERGTLEPVGRERLVSWHMERDAFGHALRHLDVLLAAQPEALGLRTQRVLALCGLGRRDEALAYLAATGTLLKERRTWGEGEMATLADTALRSQAWEQAAALYREAIRARERARRPGADPVLSGYHQQLATALIRLGQVDAAVDAAAAAVVCWGRAAAQQVAAIAALDRTLAEIRDLRGFVAARDAEAARTGRDAPLLRKRLGILLLLRGDADGAAAQLARARELQPEDTETLEALRKAHEARKDVPALCEVLLALRRYDELGELLRGRGDAERAARAFTTGVETAFDDAEPHRRLAQRFAAGERLPEAIIQWQNVVRIRALEPEGWLALAEAQLAAGLRAEGLRTAQHVLDTTWEARFGDVKTRAAALLNR